MPPHDDVVENRTIGRVEQVGVLGATRADFVEVIGEGTLEYVEAIDHPHRSEMGDVEHDGVASARFVLGDGSRRVLQRHVPAAERRHLGAECAVLGVERRVPQIAHVS